MRGMNLRSKLLVLGVTFPAIAACGGREIASAYEAGTVVTQVPSPDGHAIGRVVALDEDGAYTFELRDSESDSLLARDELRAPLGYHPHRLSIVWSEASSEATATLDHDFGDAPVTVELKRPPGDR